MFNFCGRFNRIVVVDLDAVSRVAAWPQCTHKRHSRFPIADTQSRDILVISFLNDEVNEIQLPSRTHLSHSGLS